MNMDSEIFADPRQHPDNANIPNVNRPETIIGVTITFLVGLSPAGMGRTQR
jgi:hypothetical protein